MELNKTKEKSIKINNGEKNERKEIQTRGGIQALLEVFGKHFGPLNSRPGWLSTITWDSVDQRAWWATFVAFRSEPMYTWQARRWGCIMVPHEHTAQKRVKEKIIEGSGGPGNRTQVPIPACQRVYQPCYWVSLISHWTMNKIYEKVLVAWKTR